MGDRGVSEHSRHGRSVRPSSRLIGTDAADNTESADPGVLVAGGLDPSGWALATAEIYDPVAGTWTATGSMTTPRNCHTATLLQNGHVLVAGGNGVAGAEVYDPATGTWMATGSLSTAREWHTATLLQNGRVLVAGGWGQTTAGLTSAEMYDPPTGTWTVTGALTSGRSCHTATLLQNGKVLVVGGIASDGATTLTSAEVYDPTAGTWTSGGFMATPRMYHTATLLQNGQVLIAGGEPVNASGIGTSSTELYAPASKKWAATSSMTAGRYLHTATLLQGGHVLVAGGRSALNSYLASAELYSY
jgi:galactose oxidase-like protein/Kelch motif protein